MEEQIKQVTCPQTPAKQIVQLKEEGGIKWCSRWVGNPVCAQTCLPLRMRDKRFQTPEVTS